MTDKETKPPNLRYIDNNYCYCCVYSVASPVDLYCGKHEVYVDIKINDGMPVCDDYKEMDFT